MAYGQQPVLTRPSSILSPVPADLSFPLRRTYTVTPSADLYQTPLGVDSSYQGFEEESSAYKQKFELSRNWAWKQIFGIEEGLSPSQNTRSSLTLIQTDFMQLI